MKWPWTKPTRPEIPPFRLSPPVITVPPPKDPDVVVVEHDTSEMSKTGVFRAWKRLTGQDK